MESYHTTNNKQQINNGNPDKITDVTLILACFTCNPFFDTRKGIACDDFIKIHL